MESTPSDVLNAARALTRSERAEVAQELIAELTSHEHDDFRSADLRAALEQGLTSLESGRGIQYAVDELDDYLSKNGRSAADQSAE
ncbi:MAG: hypothetical protein ACTHZ5_00345 [Micrococcaceae bacterium]